MKNVTIFNVISKSVIIEVGKVITFEGSSVLEGKSMNQTTGIFTAPFKGIYKFRFHGTTSDDANVNAVQVRLTVNGSSKAVTMADSFPQHSLALTAIIELNAGDNVACLLATGGAITYGAQFTGQLLYYTL